MVTFGKQRLLRDGIVVIATVLIVFVVLVTTNRRGLTRLGVVLAQRTQYAGKAVTVRGCASGTVPMMLMGRTAFHLVAGSDSIWVVALSGLPDSGSVIDVHGTVRSVDVADLIKIGSVIWDADFRKAAWP